MHCKRCGKAIGTDRGVCPFCGAMLSSDQIKEIGNLKKENNNITLLTERYGNPAVYYEKVKHKKTYVGVLIVFAVLLVLIIFALCFVLSHKQ